MRLLAAGLLVFCGAGFGFAAAERLRRRPRQLRQLQFALTALGSEIRFRQTPLPQGLAAVAVATGGAVGQLFADFAHALLGAEGRSPSWAWEQVKPGPELAFASEDYALLNRLALVLGAGTIDEQERQLALHLEHLGQLEQQAEETRGAKEKTWKYLGFCSGLALALILL